MCCNKEPAQPEEEAEGGWREAVWERRCVCALERVQCGVLLAGFPGEGAQWVVKWGLEPGREDRPQKSPAQRRALNQESGHGQMRGSQPAQRRRIQRWRLRQASKTGERDPGGGLETNRGKSFKGKKLAASDATDSQREMKDGPTGETWKLLA